MRRIAWLLALLLCLSAGGCITPSGTRTPPTPIPMEETEAGDEASATQDDASVSTDEDNSEDTAEADTPDQDGELIRKIYGDWTTAQGTLFTFRENGECGYYRSRNARETDYYYGWEMDILHGEAALDDLGLTGQDREVEMYSQPEYVYSFKLYYTYLHQDGEDMSHLLIDDGFQHMMFRLLDDDHAIAVAVNTMTIFNLERIASEV